MPFVQVHTSVVISADARNALGLALANAYGEYMQTSHRIVNVGFVHYAPGDLARYDASGDAPLAMAAARRNGRRPKPRRKAAKTALALKLKATSDV